MKTKKIFLHAYRKDNETISNRIRAFTLLNSILFFIILSTLLLTTSCMPFTAPTGKHRQYNQHHNNGHHHNNEGENNVKIIEEKQVRALAT